jgi:hypothetical protein
MVEKSGGPVGAGAMGRPSFAALVKAYQIFMSSYSARDVTSSFRRRRIFILFYEAQQTI